ncbi:hypothetical protein GCM10020001_110320 [Nonomuraea salmonea]
MPVEGAQIGAGTDRARRADGPKEGEGDRVETRGRRLGDLEPQQRFGDAAAPTAGAACRAADQRTVSVMSVRTAIVWT